MTNNREVTELCLMNSDPLAVMHFIVQKEFFKVSETLRTQNKMQTKFMIKENINTNCNRKFQVEMCASYCNLQ